MLFTPFGCTHPPPPVPPFLLAQNLSPKKRCAKWPHKLTVVWGIYASITYNGQSSSATVIWDHLMLWLVTPYVWPSTVCSLCGLSHPHWWLSTFLVYLMRRYALHLWMSLNGSCHRCPWPNKAKLDFHEYTVCRLTDCSPPRAKLSRYLWPLLRKTFVSSILTLVSEFKCLSYWVVQFVQFKETTPSTSIKLVSTDAIP